MKKWLVEPVQSIFAQVPRALATSVLAAFLDSAILLFLVEICAWNPMPGSIVGYLAGGLVQYVLCCTWVFANSTRNRGGLAAFTLLSLVGLGITTAVMAVHEKVHAPYMLAKVVALGLAFSWNFLSRKYLFFRPVEEPIPASEPIAVGSEG